MKHIFRGLAVSAALVMLCGCAWWGPFGGPGGGGPGGGGPGGGGPGGGGPGGAHFSMSANGAHGGH